jgi:hypothetical protein
MKEAIFPLSTVFVLIGLPIERKRLELDILLFFPPYLECGFLCLGCWG